MEAKPINIFEKFSRRPEWESAIGRLILASARLERNVLMAIANYGGHAQAIKAASKPHSARLTALERVATGRPTETRQKVAGIVELLRDFNKKRNHVAHNPITYVLDNNSTEEDRFGSIIDPKNREQRIGLDQVLELAKDGERLSDHFTFTWMMVMGSPDE